MGPVRGGCRRRKVIAMDLTEMRVEVEVTVPAPAESVWELVTDITRVGDWSPECVRAEWLDGQSAVRPGAYFRGHNRMGTREWSVTCVVVEADRPRSLAWSVLDDAEDPDRPSSRWRYDLEPLGDGTTRVSHAFVHGPGGSGLTMIAAKRPDKIEEVVEQRRGMLRSNMLRFLEGVTAELSPGGARPE
jgi:uncharacterized protein YndB with AHSA1/START domain